MCVQKTIGEDPDTSHSRVEFPPSTTEWLLMSAMVVGAVKKVKVSFMEADPMTRITVKKSL